MGNREDLLAGARRVILERGAAKATARDIAAAAGVSLAAIGYHFGSKDRLITEALTESLGTGIGDAMEQLVADHAHEPLIDGFHAMWAAMPDVFEKNREMLLASLENVHRLLRGGGGDDGAVELGSATEQAHEGMTRLLTEARPDIDPADAEAVAKLDFALIQGLGVLWMLDPRLMPSADELARAITTIATTPAAPPAAS